MRDLVLIGGGHAHVEVLRSFGMRKPPGVRLTLISSDPLTAYSGMLPGYVAGCYLRDEIHIDLVPLAQFAGARLIDDELVELDLRSNQVHFARRPPLRFDVLSLNSGALSEVASEAGVKVKPIGRFLPQFELMRSEVRLGQTVALVGGGAGGVELALAMRQALPAGVQMVLVADSLLKGFASSMVEYLVAELGSQGIVLEEGFRVVDVGDRRLRAADGRSCEADYVFWVTGVVAPKWPGRAGLDTDAGGFVKVDQTLRSTSHSQVFAAGDIACLVGQERSKAGVFAVRAGAVLADNLRREMANGRLRSYRAQRNALVLVGTGKDRAVAARGRLVVGGAWVWRWKQRIDRRFMARFNNLPPMSSANFEAGEGMRCGGCGSKLGAGLLGRVLARLPVQSAPHVLIGIGDDAAVVHSAGQEIILTVDGFPSSMSDPYRFGRIVAHHSLNDIFAMGGRGESALAFATVPLMAQAMMEDDLFQLLHGAVDVLNAAGVPLVGGHSIEGADLSLALSLTGTRVGQRLMTKGGLIAGQTLILTKSLGTGVVLAGHQRGAVRGVELEATVAQMDQSNSAARDILAEQGATGLTDVSGFGFLGHLAELLRASECGARINAATIATLPGAMRLIDRGICSSLQTQNLEVLVNFQIEALVSAGLAGLLVDPQTSGGLLAGVPEAAADACLHELRRAGYVSACRVGVVTASHWSVGMR